MTAEEAYNHSDPEIYYNYLVKKYKNVNIKLAILFNLKIKQFHPNYKFSENRLKTLRYEQIR